MQKYFPADSTKTPWQPFCRGDGEKKNVALNTHSLKRKLWLLQCLKSIYHLASAQPPATCLFVRHLEGKRPSFAHLLKQPAAYVYIFHISLYQNIDISYHANSYYSYHKPPRLTTDSNPTFQKATKRFNVLGGSTGSPVSPRDTLQILTTFHPDGGRRQT